MATESPRFNPAFACTLHLLLTLSDLFIIALWTKPPNPLVGEGGRPAEDSMLGVLPSPAESGSDGVVRSSGLKVGRSKVGDFEDVERETGLAKAASSVLDVCLSSSGNAVAAL